MLLHRDNIKKHRELLLKRQRGICPLCLKDIPPDKAALDHCHKTGRVRRVLHRWCNSVLGRIENWAGRSGVPAKDFLANSLKYIRAPQSKVLHPNSVKRKKKCRTGRKKA